MVFEGFCKLREYGIVLFFVGIDFAGRISFVKARLPELIERSNQIDQFSITLNFIQIEAF